MGGLFELVGSFMVLASFQKAIKAEMNPGISNSVVAIHGVFILVLNRLIYKDPIRSAQWLAILIILASILLLSFCFDYSSKEFYEIFHQKELTEEEIDVIKISILETRIESIVAALVACFCYAGEALLMKQLIVRWEVPGEVSGFFFLLFDGIIGTFGLVYISRLGMGVFHFPPLEIVLIILAGFCITGGVLVLNMAIRCGEPAAVLCISNSNGVVHALLAHFYLNGPL